MTVVHKTVFKRVHVAVRLLAECELECKHAHANTRSKHDLLYSLPA